MGERDVGRRLLVGLASLILLAGCASGATSSPSSTPATQDATTAPSVAVATPSVTAAPNVTDAPSVTPGASPTRSPLPTIGQPADDGASIVGVTTVDARTRDLTIQSPALGSPFAVAQVRLLLPSQFDAQPAARWPGLYLLADALDDHTSWTSNTDVETLTAPTNLLVVMPDDAVGEDGWYSDWWNGGAGGPPKWGTFHLVELCQLLERNWHTGDKLAIAGLSAGGYGAMEYASRKPGMFLAAASFSGVLDPAGRWQVIGQVSGEQLVGLWGDPVAQADVWRAHDPTDNAAALKGTALYVAYGNGKIGPLASAPSPYDTDGSQEREIAVESAAFVHQLAALKIPVTVDAYGNGTYDWP